MKKKGLLTVGLVLALSAIPASASASLRGPSALTESAPGLPTTGAGSIRPAASDFTAYATQAGGLRYCMRPDLSGAYVAASRNVKCGTAKYVSKRMMSSACVTRRTCIARGFICRSGSPGYFNRYPFEVTHHGVCTASRARRIEFDWG
jgi:hypothetical protein